MRAPKSRTSLISDGTSAVWDALVSFWNTPTADVLSGLQSSPSGLTADAAAERLARLGPNTLGERKRSDTPALLLR